MEGKIFAILVVFFGVFFVSGCQKGKSDEDFIKDTKKEVQKQARDPESVIFSDMWVNKTWAKKDANGLPLLVLVCGEANAKNLFGGYVGYQRFIAHHIKKDGENYEINLIEYEGNFIRSRIFAIKDFEDDWNMWCKKDKGRP